MHCNNKKRKKKIRGTGGYVTVEASIIVPIVIMIIGFLFSCTYHLYHRCVLSQDVYLIAFRGSAVHDQESEEIRSRIGQEAERQFGKKYFTQSRKLDHIEVNKDSIHASASVTTKNSFFSDILPVRLWTIHIEREAQMIRPIEWIRKIRTYKKMLRE